jgi:microsomal dipeptidase-like Zn-dependent dipeptidase
VVHGSPGFPDKLRANDRGIAVDLSHRGQRTSAKAIEASSKPALLTHVGCYAVHPHPRNKEDRAPYSPDLDRTDRLEIIATGLSKLGYSSDVIEKVLGKNFYRVLGEVLGAE